MGIGNLRLWIGEVVLVFLVLDCLGSLAGAVNFRPRGFVVTQENGHLSGAHERWARPKGLSAPRTRRRRSTVEVRPSQVNGSTEADLLLEFRKGVTRDPSHALSSWNRNNVSSFCTWTGVICSSPMGPVVTLNLSGHQLRGTISPSLGGLQSLSSLDLSNNFFGGSISTGIANCSNLIAVNLSVNEVSEGIPAELAVLSNLEELDLSSNQLTGAIPPSLSNLSALRVLNLGFNLIQGDFGWLDWGGFAHLESLNLSVNEISGAIPESFRNCSSLLSLDLSVNNFSGIITDIFGGLPKLQYVDLGINFLTGSIPTSLGSLKALGALGLSSNYLIGPIPPSLVNCSNLIQLVLAVNNITGEIPAQIGSLSRLQTLYLFNNSLTGPIPLSLVNCSSLTDLILNDNNLRGEIPAKIGSLSRLQSLYLWENSLTGSIPLSLMNCSSLTDLVLTDNSLGGEIPENLGMLKELNYLLLGRNNFSRGIPKLLGNTSFLLEVFLEGNSLTGLVPPEFGLLKRLYNLDLSNNFLVGQIPPLLGGSTALISLNLAGNNLNGQIPPSIGDLINLQGLYLSDNSLSGGIPAELSNCAQLSVLDLSGNFLSDNIPSDLKNLIALNQLYLNNNNLTGSISSALRQKSTGLIEISLAHNSFSGAISGFDFGSLRNLQLSLDLSHNLISGPLPSGIGALKFVQIINLSSNAFSGKIPDAFSQCFGVQSLDLSSNNLDGEVPDSLTTLQHLTFFNVSFNQLVGSVPESGPFANFSDQSFLGNPHLCGPKLARDCSTSCRGIRCHRLQIILPIVVVSIVVALALVALRLRCIPNMSHSGKRGPSNECNFQSFQSHGKFLDAIVKNMIEDPRGENVIGRGARSIVYKGFLPEGEVFALKRILSNNANDPNCEVVVEDEESGKTNDLLNEAKILAQLRHKNILKVLSFYSSVDHKALVLEYMSGGSLHQHLYEMEPCLLTWQRRLKIAMSVAQGMKYLHHDFPEPLIHRDLKPSNILLDDDFEPKIADFGTSKFVNLARLREDGEASTSTIYGTIGYMPPEYAIQPWVSTKGDVFSYGMVIIELLTRKPAGSTNVENHGKDLRSWILDNFRGRPVDLLDHFLVSECREDNTAMEQMMLLLRVGIFCTSLHPQNRPSMIDVVGMLTNIINFNVEPVIRRTIQELAQDTNP